MSTDPAQYYESCLETLASGATSAWPSIASAYTGRAYHNLDHLREMLGHLQAIPPDFAPAAAPLFGMALIYHDIVYRAGRKDNEAKSADRLEMDLIALGRSKTEANFCRSLIMATKSHQPSQKNQTAEAWLIDYDLAVLARDAAGYDLYVAGIRREFRRYPNFLYRPGRRKALQHFLERDWIYQTPVFRQRFEEIARTNIQRELAGL
ncbi:MAG: hypothetical protein AAGA31_17565 [Bacteroidota bacterium]